MPFLFHSSFLALKFRYVDVGLEAGFEFRGEAADATNALAHSCLLFPLSLVVVVVVVHEREREKGGVDKKCERMRLIDR